MLTVLKNMLPFRPSLESLQKDLRQAEKAQAKSPSAENEEAYRAIVKQIKDRVAVDEANGAGHFPIELMPESGRGSCKSVCPVCRQKSDKLCRCFVMDASCSLNHRWYTCKACHHVSWFWAPGAARNCRTLCCMNPACRIHQVWLDGDNLIDWTTGKKPCEHQGWPMRFHDTGCGCVFSEAELREFDLWVEEEKERADIKELERSLELKKKHVKDLARRRNKLWRAAHPDSPGLNHSDYE